MTPSDIMQAWQAPSDRDGVDATQLAQLPAPFAHAGWYRALTLEERLASLHAVAQPAITPDMPTMEYRYRVYGIAEMLCGWLSPL